jgi:murein DD-endopeptidase MepM/ murein hydrolase activator NlpD
MMMKLSKFGQYFWTILIMILCLILLTIHQAKNTQYGEYGAGSSSALTGENHHIVKAYTNATSEPTSVEASMVKAAAEPTVVSIVSLEEKAANVEDPLIFSFPTPMPEPASLWRPPLYEVPWALSPFDHFFFTRPISVDVANWARADYPYGGIFPGSDTIHTGIDIPSPRGTPVIAAGPGKVVWAGYGVFYGTNNSDDPYGLAVSIQHDFGYQGHHLYTIYAHMDRVDVQVGQHVEPGTQLGIVGMTGNTTGPHLHFEVRIERNSFYATRNPELWLAPPQGWGVLVGQVRNTNGSFLTAKQIKVKSLDNDQTWEAITYGASTVNQDFYYKENVVLNDLPAGDYEVSINYWYRIYSCQLIIHPGAVTYFTYQGINGFGFDLPEPPDTETWMEAFQPN